MPQTKERHTEYMRQRRRIEKVDRKKVHVNGGTIRTEVYPMLAKIERVSQENFTEVENSPLPDFVLNQIKRES